MPITPRFDISQTSDDIIVTIHVPNIRVSDDTVEVLLEEDRVLHFYASPYLLKLDFGVVGGTSEQQYSFRPGVGEKDDGTLSGKFDPAKSTITMSLPKNTQGQFWPQLDLTARLLQPKQGNDKYLNSRWLKEVIDTSTTSNSGQALDAAKDDSELLVHHMGNPSTTNSDATIAEDSDLLSPSPSYGFANMFQGIFRDFAREGMAQEMLHVPNPDGTSSKQERYQLRIDREWDEFDPERYVGDLPLSSTADNESADAEDYVYQLAMSMKPHWQSKTKKEISEPSPGNLHPSQALISAVEQLSIRDISSNDNTIPTVKSEVATGTQELDYFNRDEKLLLSTVPYPLLPDHTYDKGAALPTLWCGLIDVLFAYAYDHLVTQGESTVESAWTISTLSYSLSWLEELGEVEHVVLTAMRRQLTYPYLRNYNFGLSVWKHVTEILGGGVHTIVRCLLQCRNILEKSESFYLGNKLYIDPYLAWIQRIDDVQTRLQEIAEEIRKAIAQPHLKENLGLDLIRFESIAMDGDSSNDDEDEEESVSTCNSSDGDSHGASTSLEQHEGDVDVDGVDIISNETGVTQELPTMQANVSLTQHSAVVIGSNANAATATASSLLDSEVGHGSNLLQVVSTHDGLAGTTLGNIVAQNEEKHETKSPLITEVL